MKKLLKILGLIAGVILIVLIVGYIAISSFLTPTYLKSLVQKMASETINYPVNIRSVSLRLGLKISISIDRLEIANPPQFSTDKMVAIDRIRLNLKLLPLLRRQIEIGSITIDGIDFKIERNKNNVYNIAIPTTQRQQGTGWRLELNELSISRGNISYIDAVSQAEFQIKDMRQTIKFKNELITFNGNQTLYVLKIKKLPELVIKINNTIEYDTTTKNINIKELKASYEPIELKVTGTLEKSEMLNLKADLKILDLAKMVALLPKEYRPDQLGGSIKMDITALGSTKEPKLNGKCELINIAIKPAGLNRNIEKINGSFAFDMNSIKNIIIQGLLGTSRFDISGSINNLKDPILDIVFKFACNLKDIETISNQTQGMKLSGFANLNIAIKGNASNPNYYGDYTVSEAIIDGIGLVRPITNFKAKGSIQRDGAKITECTGHIGRSDFSFSGYVSNFKKPVVQINNNSNLIDLDELLPKTKPEKKTEQKGIPLSINGKIRINKLTGMDMEFRNINTNFTFENGIVDLKNCNAETFDGKVQFDFYYNSNSPEPYRLHSRMENISAEKILKRFLKFDNLQGRLSGVNNFQGKGFMQKEVIANLTASGNVKLTNGVFSNFEFLNKLFKWLGYEDIKSLPLNDLVCSFKIVNGKTDIEDWSMSTKVGNFLTNGTIRLDGAINMNITLTLNKRESDLLKKYHGDWLLYFDKNGRATIDIIATGKLLSPQFKLDTNKIKERIKGKIKDEYDKKKSELEKKLKDLLKK
ncbi:MAG: AsmA family protein [candidate division WOR-3 bacterium]